MMYNESNKYKKGHTAVFGIYNSRYTVDSAVDQLKSKGFRNSDISVLMPTKEGTQDFAHEKATKAPEGATTGASTGALLGGGLGWLVGLGALAIPGIGPFVAAGPIMAALAGAGVGGAVGGIAGGLIGMGIPEYEAKRYEGFVKQGGILLSVHVDDAEWERKAKDLLTASGARDVASSSEENTRDTDANRASTRETIVTPGMTSPANPMGTSTTTSSSSSSGNRNQF